MQSVFGSDLKAFETLFVVDLIDYQYFQYEWSKCNVEEVQIENCGDHLKLEMKGSDSLGSYEFYGQIRAHAGKYVLLCKKAYNQTSRENCWLHYNGYFDSEENQFSGSWYFGQCQFTEEEGIYTNETDLFFIKFKKEE